MSKNKVLEKIEEGLLEYYISLDYGLNTENIKEKKTIYDNEDLIYSKMAKKILFKAKFEAKKSLHSKVISLFEASEKLTQLDKEMEGKVFPIFKKHIKEHGLAANYRNFDSMTENEMKNILSQLNHTALLDSILSDLEDE